MITFIKKNNLIIFLFVALLYVYLEVMNYDKMVINIATPIIISTLFLFYIIVAKRKSNLLYVLVLLLQLIGGMIITKQGDDNFLIGFSIYFLVNILLILIVTSKLGIITTNEVYTKYAPFTLLFSIVIYYIFAQIGVFKILFLVYGVVAAIFASLAYHYHYKSFKDSTFWMLYGSLAYLVCDVFTGLYFLVSKNIYYDIGDSVFYLTAIYCINYSMILDVSQNEKTLQ